MKNPEPFYPRLLRTRIGEAMADTPVVLIVGPRQAGKTTLVKQLADLNWRYLTLDDEITRLAAHEDPASLIRSLDRAIIVEIQRAPHLLMAIKKSVDEDRRPGRFLLTGSANLMTLPTVAESLAGRMESLTLLPLAQIEIDGGIGNWLDRVFSGRIPKIDRLLVGRQLIEIVLRGGYPEAVSRATKRRRTTWTRQYLDALISRDVREIAGVDRLDLLPRLLRALAQVSGQLCNYTRLGGEVALDSKTVARYLGIFEQMYLVKRVEAWSGNRLSRMVKTPKLQFLDSGLLATLMSIEDAQIPGDQTRFGHLLESFVYAELQKHCAAAEGDYQFLYYRDHDQFEVDLVIENAAGHLIGVEIKASATVRVDDLKGLKRLAGIAGAQFKMGLVLYDGAETLPIGQNLWAAPISTLWGS